jgi:hypothetical protein
LTELSERGAAAAVAAEAWRPERTRRGAGNERTEQRRDGGFMSAAVAESESGNAGDLVCGLLLPVCVCVRVCVGNGLPGSRPRQKLLRGAKKEAKIGGKNTEKRIVAMAHFHTTGASLIVNVRN